VTLHLDFETFSPLDLKKCGVYKTYAHPQAGIHCMAWRIDDGPVRVWTPGQPFTSAFLNHVERTDREVVAHNANFERTIWRQIMEPRYGLAPIALERWRCTMAQARALALPAGLEDCCSAIGLPIKKDPVGYGVMLKFCKPRKVNDDGTFEWWHDDPAQAEKLDHLYEYCANDVEMECQLDARLLRLRPEEQALWRLDQRINDRGVETDPDLARRAEVVVTRTVKRLNDQMWGLSFLPSTRAHARNKPSIT
jgi:DNA polymerase